MAGELRSIAYRYMFPVADDDGSTSAPRRGDLSDLLRDADSYLFMGNPVPPLRVVNDLLSRGISDLGMGGGAEWDPFGIEEPEYASFLDFLDTPEGKKKFNRQEKVRLATPPTKVNTIETYSVWSTRELMADPNHHFNTQKVWAVINGKKVTMTLGQSILSDHKVHWHWIR
ncbi:MAG: hypothetical protein AAFR21_03715 [Pseudomonadota bacterium]